MDIELKTGEVISVDKIKILSVKKSDVVVIECAFKITDSFREKLENIFKELTGMKVVILEEGMSVSSILRKE